MLIKFQIGVPHDFPLSNLDISEEPQQSLVRSNLSVEQELKRGEAERILVQHVKSSFVLIANMKLMFYFLFQFIENFVQNSPKIPIVGFRLKNFRRRNDADMNAEFFS